VTERIRNTVVEIDFSVNGEHHELSVSIGGAAYTRAATFAELFRITDQQLYIAKNGGRNRIEMIGIPRVRSPTEMSSSLH
jgi:diguanylate cyclase